MDANWLDQIFSHEELHGMGHGQDPETKNLGLGWLYYATARMYRPKRVLCIGSWRGFVPLVFAKALQENDNGGDVLFIDPSMVDDFWADPQRVSAWFQSFGLENVTHFKNTTQEFVETQAYKDLGTIDFLFVDGYHTEEQARFDHESFAPLLSKDGLIFFHDSLSDAISKIYGPEKGYQYSVHKYVAALKATDQYQCLDFPCPSGLSVFQKKAD